IALNGKSEETPPKQVRLTELKVSRCLRKSLLPSSVRSKVSSDSESQVIIMRVFPAVKAEARSCGQDKPFCLRCFAGSVEKALADFNQASAQAPENAYLALWVDIVSRRNNLPSRLAQTSSRIDMTVWPAPAVRVFLA